MSLESTIFPNFAEYSSALRRLQNRAALRRAVMSAEMGGSFEVLAGEDQERRDRELLDVWERHSGVWLGY